MQKKYKLIIITALSISYLIGIYVGIYFYSNIRQNNTLTEKDKEERLILQTTKEVSKNMNKVKENSKIIYKIFYKDSEFTEVIEDIIPYYIVGLNREEVQEQFKDWTLESFSSNQIILKKVVQNNNYEEYFLTEYNGNIAVFSENKLKEENLIEVTNKPVISLPEEEQLKIKEGFYIKGKKELINYIQDYES